jgi:hypothetical protein
MPLIEGRIISFSATAYDLHHRNVASVNCNHLERSTIALTKLRR